ncbi:MAG: nodulation protein NfeD [Candidatus Eisenbacteria bacterium]|nr:nodulation protein NfeD [Candidatus Eisenbacteria bacterium]
MRRVALVVTALLGLALAVPPLHSKENVPYVGVVTVKGVIDPIVAQYLIRVVEEAKEDNASCIIVQIDTPGGLDTSMRQIVQAFLNSKIPTVVFVSPRGARAASAGAFIAMSASVIAMAPGTSIGAAHPVDMEGKTASDKITNDAASYMRSIAKRRGRSLSWAEDAVRKSISSSVDEAMRSGVVDLKCEDLPALVDKLDGMKVKALDGEETISTKGLPIRDMKMSMREDFLHTISHPNLAYVLFILGIYGLIYEFANPGAVLPGIVGSICLILALVAFETLPLNLAGLFLIIFSVVLFIADIKIPGHGTLTVGGVVSFVIGSLMLYEPSLPYFKVSLSLILSVAVFTGLFFLFAVTKGIRAQKRKVVSGVEGVIGMKGEAKSDIDRSGFVLVGGEQWNAFSESGTIKEGDRIEVIGNDGLKLNVRRIGNP